MHFLHINVNSLLSKIGELRYIVGHSKPAILGITGSKLDSSVSDQDVNRSGYSILRGDRNRYVGGTACCVRSDLCFNKRNVSIEKLYWKCIFRFTYSKSEASFVGIFYRKSNANTFLKTFINNLKLIDLKKTEFYFPGDFNIYLVFKENQWLDFRNISTPK